jgi:hypothetical protein
MSQRTARHDSRTESEEDATERQGRPPERNRSARPQQAVGRPADGGTNPDEPDEDEFELIGDDDLGAADLGPAAPDFTDPDTPSGRTRK